MTRRRLVALTLALLLGLAAAWDYLTWRQARARFHASDPHRKVWPDELPDYSAAAEFDTHRCHKGRTHHDH